MSANKKSGRPIKGTKPGATHATGPGGLDAAEFAAWYRAEAKRCWSELDLAGISRLADAITAAQENGRSVFIMGNGGSAATASHMATDLSKTAARGDKPALKCVSLADNVSYITAIANDLSYDDVFSRQLENLVQKGDVVLLITGSGNSGNLLKAAALAKKRGATSAALLGFDGGKLKGLVDLPILVSSDQYGVIEDLHLSVGHILTFYLKQRR